MLVAIAIAVSFRVPAYAGGIGQFAERVDFLTEYYIYQDVRTFFNHKNQAFRDAYLMAALTEFDAVMVSVDSVFHVGAFFDNYLGMGRQSAAILFDPQEVNYALAPYFEFRNMDIVYNVGIDHHCYHQVDSDTRQPANWNQLYIRVASANYRFQRYKEKYLGAGRDGYLDRLRWQVTAGYFIRKLGDVDKTILSGGHPWGSAATVDAGYYVYRTKSWLLGAESKLSLRGDTTGAAYWGWELGIGADVYNRGHTCGVFIIYNCEFPKELPMFSKDRLFEVGIRFRY